MPGLTGCITALLGLKYVFSHSVELVARLEVPGAKWPHSLQKATAYASYYNA